jgi:uncharacterized membrane protein YdcZ (DUF606 family)
MGLFLFGSNSILDDIKKIQKKEKKMNINKFFGFLVAVLGLAFAFHGILSLAIDTMGNSKFPDGYPVSPQWTSFLIALGGIFLLMASGWIASWPKKNPKNRRIKPKRQRPTFYEGHSQSSLKS